LTTRLPMYAAGIAGTCVAHEGGHPTPATSTTIDRGFLDTLRIPLLEGRDFGSADKADGPPVGIVNQTLARRLWPVQFVVGRNFQVGWDRPRTRKVVRGGPDAKTRTMTELTLPPFYLPFSQSLKGGIV